MNLDVIMTILKGSTLIFISSLGTPLYRTAAESGNNRNRKKIMGKSTWFKGDVTKNKTNLNIGTEGGNKKHNKKDGYNSGRELRTRKVIFVEHTPRGELARRLREM